MCQTCDKHDTEAPAGCEVTDIDPTLHDALKRLFHFPAVLSAAFDANPDERENLSLMIFSALEIARRDKQLFMLRENSVLADGAIVTTYYFPEINSRLAVAQGAGMSKFVLDFSFDHESSSRPEMVELDLWFRGLS